MSILPILCVYENPESPYYLLFRHQIIASYLRRASVITRLNRMTAATGAIRLLPRASGVFINYVSSNSVITESEFIDTKVVSKMYLAEELCTFVFDK